MSSTEDERKKAKREKKEAKKAKKEAEAQQSPPPPASSSADTPDAEAAAASPASDDSSIIRLFDASSPRRERMKLHYIDTLPQLGPALAAIRASSCLSVDCEGVALSRTGAICLVQVSTACDPVTRLYDCYLFDVVALGDKAFTTGLGAILSAPQPTKLFYDVRRDSEALYHQFGVHLRGVCDMQLMELASRRSRNQSVVYLPGLARLLGDRFTDLDASLQSIKDGMSGKYEAQPDLWQRRPLTRDQTIYAAVDVVLLHLLLDELTTPPMDKQKPKSGEEANAAAPASADKEGAASDKPAKTTDAPGPSAPAATVGSAGSRPVTRSSMYVNEQTRALVQQYSDIVWAASIRDLDSEPDQWARRHVPLEFQHATFPLSLQATCAAVQASKDAKEARQREAAEAAKNKGSKRKGAPDSEGKKIAASFSAAAADSAAAAAAASPAQPASSSSSLSSFVQRLARTPAARSNYSGLANTLKHMRKQQAVAGVGNRATVAAAEPTSSDSKRKGRTLQAAAGVSSSASTPLASAAGAATRVPALRVGSIVGDPSAFHPQVTPAVVAQLAKQGQASQPSLKKHKVSHAF